MTLSVAAPVNRSAITGLRLSNVKAALGKGELRKKPKSGV
jgi:hypothetical protein